MERVFVMQETGGGSAGEYSDMPPLISPSGAIVVAGPGMCWKIILFCLVFVSDNHQNIIIDMPPLARPSGAIVVWYVLNFEIILFGECLYCLFYIFFTF